MTEIAAGNLTKADLNKMSKQNMALIQIQK